MRLATVFLASLLFASGCAHAATSDAVRNADRLMQKYAGDVPGASLLVLKDGKPLLRRGYGLANLEHREKASPATDYRLASVSKQFTAAAILLLAEDGKLALDDSIRHWLPTLPANTDKVTLRQLLSHTGGLIDYEDLIPPAQTTQVNDQDVLKLLSATSKSYFAPGTSYRYSNTGYVLLGLVVEKASGESLPAFMQQRIFKPLHMDHTLLYVHDAKIVPNRAYGYSEIDGSGSAPTRASPAPPAATAASTRRSTTWRNGMPRCTTPACSAMLRASSPSARTPRSPANRTKPATASAGASPATRCGTRAKASASAT